MNIAYKESINIPDYAICYLVNGDSSGLNEEEIILIDTWINVYYAKAEELYGHLNIVQLNDDDSGSFDSFPPFGLACNTFECELIILSDNKHAKMFNDICEEILAGLSIQVSTHTTSKIYKHISQFKLKSDGIYVQRGNNWDCINYCKVKSVRL